MLSAWGFLPCCSVFLSHGFYPPPRLFCARHVGFADAEHLLGKLLVSDALLAEISERPYREQRQEG